MVVKGDSTAVCVDSPYTSSGVIPVGTWTPDGARSFEHCPTVDARRFESNNDSNM